MKTLAFVIARYSEDVSWLLRLPENVRVHVYNKGQGIGSEALGRQGITVRPLKNMGRETGTYLHHLHHWFDHSEAEFTVFSQGDPFRHSPFFYDLIDRWHLWADVQPLSNQFKQERLLPPPEVIRADRREWVEELSVRAERFSVHTLAPCSYLNGPALHIGYIYRALHGLSAADNLAEHFFRRCGLEGLAASAAEADIGFQAYGAIFAVRNRLLRERLRELGPHLEIMESIANYSEKSAPAWWNYGHIFEVLWLHLLGAPFVRLPSLRSQVLASGAR